MPLPCGLSKQNKGRWCDECLKCKSYADFGNILCTGLKRKKSPTTCTSDEPTTVSKRRKKKQEGEVIDPLGGRVHEWIDEEYNTKVMFRRQLNPLGLKIDEKTGFILCDFK